MSQELKYTENTEIQGIAASPFGHTTSLSHQLCQKSSNGDFPGGPVVMNLPCNAGNGGSIPGRGTKIPRAVEQLSPCAEDHGVQLRSEAPKLIS